MFYKLKHKKRKKEWKNVLINRKLNRWIKAVKAQTEKTKNLKPPDYVIIFLTSILIIFGILMVFDSSVVFSYVYFNDKYKFLYQQLIWTAIGVVIMAITYKIDYHNYRKLTIPLLIMTIFLLVIVLLFGKRISGAQRWIDLVHFSVQPSELVKLTFILYLASWLSKKKDYTSWKDYLSHELFPFIFSLSVITGMIIAGRDMGTAILVFLIAFFLYIIAVKNKYQRTGILLTFLFFLVVSITSILIEKYRIGRIGVYLDLLKGNIRNPEREGYQINQVLIAIGSGGLFGRGFTNSLQKYDLVETTAATDSIIAIIGEELGFFSLVALTTAYVYFALRAFKIALKAPDSLGLFAASGMGIWVVLQAFVNIGANIGLIPMTGVPLPFISYGGSSLVTLMAGVGILLNISRQTINK